MNGGSHARTVRLPGARDALIAVAASAVVAATLVFTVEPLSRIPAHWPLLIAVMGMCVGVLVVFTRQDRLVEPLPLIAAVLLSAFAGRALQLMLSTNELLGYRPSSGDLSTGLTLRSQEIAIYMTRKLAVGPDAAITRALAVLAVFAVALGLGYRSNAGRRLGRRLASIGRDADALDMRTAVAALMAIGLAGHAAIYARIGGPITAIGNILGQANLEVPFAFLIAAGSTTVAVVLWYVWYPPRSPAERFWHLAAVAETVVFWSTTGSRTHALAPLFGLFVARHYVRGRWRLSQILGITAVLVVCASTYLVIRQATYSSTLGEAVRSAPRYVLNPNATLFDNTTFDDFLAAVNTYGETAPFDRGGAVVDAVRSFVPASIDPERPAGADIEFRKLVLGDSFQGGRPYSLMGDLWRDFGFLSVALGGLLLGLLVRGVAGLAGGGVAGRRTRVLLLALAMLLLYQLLVGVYSIAIGDLIELGVPLALAFGVFARHR